MLSANFSAISHWFRFLETYVPAIAITAASAVLIGCAVSGACAPCKEKDQVFHKHVW